MTVLTKREAKEAQEPIRVNMVRHNEAMTPPWVNSV